MTSIGYLEPMTKQCSHICNVDDDDDDHHHHHYHHQETRTPPFRGSHLSTGIPETVSFVDYDPVYRTSPGFSPMLHDPRADRLGVLSFGLQNSFRFDDSHNVTSAFWQDDVTEDTTTTGHAGTLATAPVWRLCHGATGHPPISRARLTPQPRLRRAGDYTDRSRDGAGRPTAQQLLADVSLRFGNYEDDRFASTPTNSETTVDNESDNRHPPTIAERKNRRRPRTSLHPQPPRVRINVSGHRFEMSASLLDRHPDTLLGDPVRRRTFYDRRRDELFLDRHRPSFEAIFSYYQVGGRLRRPPQVPDDIFLAEVVYYDLEAAVVDEYKLSEGYVNEEVSLPTNEVLREIWTRLEYPETSRSAYAIAVVSVLMTLVSIVLFCVETLPPFAMTHCGGGGGGGDRDAPNFLDPFFVIETVCTSWFSVELALRFVSSPDKFRFWRDLKNLVDLTAIVPYYVTFVNVVSTMSCATAKSSASLAFLRVIRLVRVFKLTKHSVGLQVLVLTFKASIEGLSLFLVALIVCLLVYSSAIYYAELEIPNSQIQSIPDAFWWAIITMTTVGYGDKVPLGPVGKLIGAACAITGVLTLAIPVPIITGHFNRFYSHKTGRGRRV